MMNRKRGAMFAGGFLVLACVGSLVAHDLFYSAFSSPVLGSAEQAPTEISADVARESLGAGTALDFSVTQEGANPAGLGYEIRFESESGSVEGSSVVPVVVQRGEVEASGEGTWQIPAAAPAGRYSIYPYTPRGNGREYGISDSFVVRSEASGFARLRGNFDAIISESDTASVLMVAYATNPSAASRRATVEWKAVEAVSGKEIGAYSRVVELPAGAEKIEIAQRFRRDIFSTLLVTATLKDGDFPSSVSALAAGALPATEVAVACGFELAESSLWSSAYELGVCTSPSQDEVVVPASVKIGGKGTLHFLGSGSTSAGARFVFSAKRYLVPFRGNVTVQSALPDGSYAVSEVAPNGAGRAMAGRQIAAGVAVLLAMVLFYGASKKVPAYQSSL